MNPESVNPGRDADAGVAEAPAGSGSLGRLHMSLREAITEEIRQAILTGRYQPGARLVEDRLAAEYGVSRNPVREALRSLQSEGLVEVSPRRGAAVAKFSEAEAREIIELRASLEGLSARLAARRRSPELQAQVRALIARGEAAAGAEDDARLREINEEFHNLLAGGGHNRFLTEFMRMIRDKTYWLTTTTRSWRGAQSWAEHAAILRAITDGDEELAAVLASRHVANAGRSYLQSMRRDKDGKADGPEILETPATPVRVE